MSLLASDTRGGLTASLCVVLSPSSSLLTFFFPLIFIFSPPPLAVRAPEDDPGCVGGRKEGLAGPQASCQASSFVLDARLLRKPRASFRFKQADSLAD